MRYTINLLLDTPDSSASLDGRRGSYTLSNVLHDPAVILLLAMSFAVTGWIFHRDYTDGKRHTMLVAEIAEGIRDSTQLDEEVYLAENLRQRQIEITKQLDRVRRIDQGRYVWAHLMDEFALAAPDELWLESWQELGPVEGSPHNVKFRLEGLAANHEVLATFLRNLEGSAFVADVAFTRSSQENVSGEDVIRFVIEGRSEDPDPALLEMITISPTGATGPENALTSSATGSLAPDLPLVASPDSLETLPPSPLHRR